MSGDGDDFTITVARRKYPIFQIYIYLQRICRLDDRGISAMKTKISTVKIREIFRTYM